MTPAEIRKRVEVARSNGAAARRACRPRGANPYRGSTMLVVACRDAWLDGWESVDSTRRTPL